MTPAEVRQIRERLNLTQHELAEALQVSQVCVSHWEKGLRPCQGPAAVLLNRMHAEHEKKLAKILAR